MKEIKHEPITRVDTTHVPLAPEVEEDGSKVRSAR